MQKETAVLTGQHYKEDRTKGYNQTGSTTGFHQIN